jgi:hypothetical protein
MNRRTLIAGIGALATSSAASIGSGAFTTVSAKRSVTVDVADDKSALLSLDPLSQEGINGQQTGRAFILADHKVMFSIPGVGPGENDSAAGVAPDSVYEFHDLLRIENQGTQTVTIGSTYNGDALNDLALVRSGESSLLRDDPPTLNSGESLDIGLYLDTHGSSLGEFDETLTIVADSPDG